MFLLDVWGSGNRSELVGLVSYRPPELLVFRPDILAEFCAKIQREAQGADGLHDVCQMPYVRQSVAAEPQLQLEQLGQLLVRHAVNQDCLQVID
ncbi:MAG TPA: hypothetical protein VH475_13885 [Tepidisphaeraceae bacterium]|jgi:hypothetical protein